MKSDAPDRPIVPTVDPTLKLFRTTLAGAAFQTLVFCMSWLQSDGVSTVLGLMVSTVMLLSGATLVLTLRASRSTAPSPVRIWMRPAAIAVLSLGVVMAGMTFWRWRH